MLLWAGPWPVLIAGSSFLTQLDLGLLLGEIQTVYQTGNSGPGTRQLCRLCPSFGLCQFQAGQVYTGNTTLREAPKTKPDHIHQQRMCRPSLPPLFTEQMAPHCLQAGGRGNGERNLSPLSIGTSHRDR